MTKKRKRIKFRASGVGVLMTGGNELTENQEQELSEYKAREAGTFLTSSGKIGALTPSMMQKMKTLQDKKDAPFEFGDTAKTFIEDKWLHDVYGVRNVVEVKQTLKGKRCEQDAMELVSRVIPAGEFRFKNRDHYGKKSKWFTGTPDIVLKVNEKIVEDIKTCFEIFTYMRKNEVEHLYFSQLQCYMDLVGYDRARLLYCLVNTPHDIIRSEARKYLYMYGGEIDNPDYLEALDQLIINHTYDEIPDQEKVKIFEIERDDVFLKKLKERTYFAQDYYYGLSLGQIRTKVLG